MTDDAVAVVLEREAGAVAELLDAVALASGPDTWQGPAADQFAEELDGHRRMLRTVADELRMTARRLVVAPARVPRTAQ